MQKKVLSEQALYYGDVAMPKDWDIDRDKLQNDILQSEIQFKNFPFSRTLGYVKYLYARSLVLNMVLL